MQDFPGGSDSKASAYNARDLGSIPRLEDLLEKEMAAHSSVLAWRIPGTGSLVGCCLRGRTESDTTEVT